MKPATPPTLRSRTATEDGKTERPPLTRLRKEVFGNSLTIVTTKLVIAEGQAFDPELAGPRDNCRSGDYVVKKRRRLNSLFVLLGGLLGESLPGASDRAAYELLQNRH